jgi:16S rRNA (guanine(966)-N(2))-methyltransferase RsmD
LRIIRGSLKSRRIGVPKGFPSRPTTDFAKEGLFNILENQIDLEDKIILDLCSGTGNISFEFISRDAKNVTCVDSNFFSVKHIRKVAIDFGVENQIYTLKDDILRYLNSCSNSYDIVFCDPPYDLDIHQQVHHVIFEKKILNKNGLLIIEHGKNTKLNNLNFFQFERSFGNVIFSFFKFETE